ncbi:MAG: hypothetical protein MUF16_00135 [Burkholderiaceae bacterium]|jgi:hypothetical protein|nr:hypothetical protein [Burkholderiaceae bacterium]
MSRITSRSGARNGIGATQDSIRRFCEDDDTEDDREKPGFVHLQTSAAQAGAHKPAGVPASVFEAGRLAGAAQRKGKAPRVKAPPLPHIGSIVIEAGVPCGPSVKPKLSRLLWEQLLERMKPGASVVLHDNHARSLALAARKRGVPLTLRRLTPTETRVWRLERVVDSKAKR